MANEYNLETQQYCQPSNRSSYCCVSKGGIVSKPFEIPCCEDGSVEPHPMLGTFKHMAQFTPLFCYTDEQISANLYLGESMLQGQQLRDSSSYPYAVMLYAAHLFEIGKVQATESAGRLAEVSRAKQPTRPSGSIDGGIQAASQFWEIGYVYSIWGQQLRSLMYQNVLSMFSI